MTNGDFFSQNKILSVVHFLKSLAFHAAQSVLGEDDADDEAEKRDSLGEDHHENNSNEDVLVDEAAHACVAAHTDRHARTQTGKADAEARAQVAVRFRPGVFPLVRCIVDVDSGSSDCQATESMSKAIRDGHLNKRTYCSA